MKARAKGNDVITNVIYANQQFASTFSMQIFKFQRRSCKFLFLFPPRRRSAPESLVAGYTWQTSGILLGLECRWVASQLVEETGHEKRQISKVKITTVLQFMLEIPWRYINLMFSVHKLWLNKLMRRFYWSVKSKWKERYWKLCSVRSTKEHDRSPDELHDHSSP